MNRSVRLIVAILTACAAVIFAYTLYRSTVAAPASDELSVPDEMIAVSTTAPVVSSAGKPETPTHISIPAIGVEAGVVDVGLGKSGNMAVPYTYTDAGWYRYGTLPGAVGSAVLDGHVDNGLGGGAVFARLGELKAGDDLYIESKEGQRLHFVVEEVASYAVADVPLQKLFTRDDKPRLNLITCEGAWIAEQKMYDRRLVVYATLAQ